MADIDLGFPEERDSRWLTNRYFPSKIGGTPAWLELDALPSSDVLKCNKCNAQQAFLCQIYAPFEDEHSFHRVIYVFICRSADCQQANTANNLTVLRSQLPRSNDFYSAEPPVEAGDPQPAISGKRRLCIACGCLGPLSCSRCKKANYCSSQHQRAHWSQHKKMCAVQSTSQEATQDTGYVPLTDIVFPQWEIVIEPNDREAIENNNSDDADSDSDAAEKARLNEFKKLAAEGKTGEFKDMHSSELDKFTHNSEALDDKYFRKFKKELNKDPEQILRYKRNGQPLWIADVEQTVAAQLIIPPCEYCSGERQFEFQIMPQMLLVLKDERLDWGVLAVYTCANSCKPLADAGYLKEYIVKQDILDDKQ